MKQWEAFTIITSLQSIATKDTLVIIHDTPQKGMVLSNEDRDEIYNKSNDVLYVLTYDFINCQDEWLQMIAKFISDVWNRSIKEESKC